MKVLINQRWVVSCNKLSNVFKDLNKMQVAKNSTYYKTTIHSNKIT